MLNRLLCPLPDWGLMNKPFQQSCTASQHIPPCGFEVPRIPGIGHIAGVVGKLLQQMNPVIGIVAAYAVHIPQIGLIHSNQRDPADQPARTQTDTDRKGPDSNPCEYRGTVRYYN